MGGLHWQRSSFPGLSFQGVLMSCLFSGRESSRIWGCYRRVSKFTTVTSHHSLPQRHLESTCFFTMIRRRLKRRSPSSVRRILRCGASMRRTSVDFAIFGIKIWSIYLTTTSATLPWPIRSTSCSGPTSRASIISSLVSSWRRRWGRCLIIGSKAISWRPLWPPMASLAKIYRSRIRPPRTCCCITWWASCRRGKRENGGMWRAAMAGCLKFWQRMLSILVRR